MAILFIEREMCLVGNGFSAAFQTNPQPPGPTLRFVSRTNGLRR
jgi:hypothetical protein